MADQVRDRRPPGRDDHAGLPAEEHDRRDCEDEAERDAAGVDALQRARESARRGPCRGRAPRPPGRPRRVRTSARTRRTPPQSSRPPPRQTGATIARTLGGTGLGAFTAPPRPPQAVDQGRVRTSRRCGLSLAFTIDLPFHPDEAECYQAPQPKLPARHEPSQAASAARRPRAERRDAVSTPTSVSLQSTRTPDKGILAVGERPR